MHIIQTTGTVINDNATASVVLAARAKLEQIVANGVAKAGPVVERILSETPEDRLVLGKALRFSAAPGTFSLRLGSDVTLTTHNHAFAQLVEKAGGGFQLPYAEKLRDGGPDEAWKRELLEHALGQHYAHQPGRYLVRSVSGQARGFLSNKFRRLDSRPLLEAFITACKGVQAVPFEGVANEVRASVRAIIPRVFEPVPGEAMVFGLAWNNSEYGAGVYGISAFVLRLVCLNGMVGESALRQVHLGKALTDDFSFSQKTYDLDTKLMVSATNDIVKSVLAPEAIAKRATAVKEAHETTATWKQAFAKVGSILTKAEEKSALEAFEGEDTIMLPPGQTLWRASNALSWIANQAKDPARKLELQQAAGKVLAA